MAGKKKPAQKHPGGRPTKYDPSVHPALAESLAREGLTNTEIAEALGIDRATLHNWQNAHKEFFDSVKSGKETPNDNVEKSLYRRALGYEYTETKITKNEDGVIVKTETTVKQVAPDVGAQCMWLKNRRPQDWRDKQEIKHSGSVSWVDLVKHAETDPEKQ